MSRTYTLAIGSVLFILCSTVEAQPLPPLFEKIQNDDLEGVRAVLDGGTPPNSVVQGTSALLFAASEGTEEIALLLLERGADPKEVGQNGFTPLHAAMTRCRDKLGEKLIAKGADINAKTNQAVTPLHIAADKGCLDTILFLVKKGADIDALAEGDIQPVHLAAATWNATTLKHLLDKGANPNAKAKGGLTPLHMAADKQNKDELKLLLDRKADPNVATDEGITPLHIVCEKGDIETVGWLLDKKANVNAKTKTGLTPLLLACAAARNEKLVALFLDKGADVKVAGPDGATPLHFAVERGWNDLAERMLKAGADPSAKTTTGVTPLALARDQNLLGLIALLEKSGADAGDPFLLIMSAASEGSPSKMERALALEGAAAKVNNRDPEGNAPLHASAFKGCTSCVRLLLDAGADVNGKNNGGNTPLHFAADQKEWTTARVLLRYGADLNAKNNDGKTPVDIAELHELSEILTQRSLTKSLIDAARNGQTKPIEDFLGGGGDASAEDDVATMLHYALGNGQTKTAELLIAKGARLDTRPFQGEPVLFLAIRRKDATMLNFLLDRGAKLSVTGEYAATPFLVSLAIPWREGAELLLKKGAVLTDKATLFDYGPLHYAVLGGDIELVRMLLDKGLDVNSMPGYKGSALHLAAQEGKIEIVKLLVSRGADVNAAAPEYSQTPLHRAASSLCTLGGDYEPLHPIDNEKFCAGKLDVVRFLIEKGARVNDEDKNGWLPLDEVKDPAIQALLESHGAKRKKTAK